MLSVAVTGETEMAHMMSFIDVHKSMLAVVVGDAGTDEQVQFVRRKFGTGAEQVKICAEFLEGLGVKEVCMESTAQYWKPIWGELEERGFHLELAQAQSNRGPKGRKSDFKDAERGWRRYVAEELILSYVPKPEQRIWRTQSRSRLRLGRDRARLQNQLEALLEEMRIKLSSVTSDLLGVSTTRMLRAIAQGETDLEKLAALADPGLRASQAQLCDALNGVKNLDARYLVILKQYLERLDLIDRQSEELQKGLAQSLVPHQDEVQRLANVPGLGVDSAQQIIAEIGPGARNFATAADLASWVGVCPGQNESAEKNSSDASPKGNRYMRRLLTEAAKSAIKAKGTVFQKRYQRLVGRDPKKWNEATWAVAHHILRVVWKILHDVVCYEERGDRNNPKADRRRAARLLRQLKQLGYKVTAQPLASPA
jgi:transposase